MKKNQLYQIPALMDELAKNPLKFILFIDDLSFASNDDNFAALKAILEGGVGGRSHNVAVYATSNRRHLVKETMADRSGDDLHAMDTRQEFMSLSAAMTASCWSWRSSTMSRCPATSSLSRAPPLPCVPVAAARA